MAPDWLLGITWGSSLERELAMPKRASYLVRWSEEQEGYYVFDQEEHAVLRVDGAPWFSWLNTHTSFSFRGQQGQLSLLKEARPRGEGYWYAYRRQGKRMRKQYLGRSSELTAARLEEVAALLSQACSPNLPSERSEQPPALLLSKFCFPRLSPSLLARPRLMELLRQDSKVILLVAPAGFGKTALARQWIEAQRQETRVAWLSPGPEDDDLIHFWRSMLTSCEYIAGRPGHAARQQLLTEQAFFSESFLKKLLTTFLNDVAAQREHLLLIIDDYHLITSPQVHETLAYLIDGLPPTMRVMLLSRAEPELPLARWRARGELQELHSSELRFSAEERTAFMEQAVPVSLAREQLEMLDRRLEGWPAGFRLLALALQGKHEVREIEQVLAGFSGGHRYLLDYLTLEVLSSLPEERQTFLLCTSLLGRMTGPLCDAVTECRDSEQILREMERSGSFLQALGGEPPWYRYCSFFAEALQTRARQLLSEEEIRRYLWRASVWYERENMPGEAVETALAARAWERAALLMERMLADDACSMLLDRETLLRWQKALPEPVFEAHPGLCVHYAAALLMTLDRRSSAVMAQIEEPLTRAERIYEERGEWGKLGEALSCHAEVARWQGNLPLALDLARKALSFPPEPPMRWRGASVLIVVKGEMEAGRPEEARRLLLQGLQLLGVFHFPGYSFQGVTLLGEMAWLQGRIRQAEQYYQQVLASAQENPVDRIQALLGVAKVFYEWNRLAEAERYAMQALELGRAQVDALGPYFVETGFLFHGELLLACLAQARGELSRAQEMLQRLLACAQERQLTPYCRMVLEQQVRLSLASGNLTVLEDWQALSQDTDDEATLMQREQHDLLRARILIARGQSSEALHLLEAWREDAHAWRRIRSELEVLMLLTLAYAASARLDHAKQTLKAALILAQPEGFQHLFLEKGEVLAAVLRVLFLELREEPLMSYARGLLLAFANRNGEQQAASGSPMALLWGPLTEAEQRVLGLLAGGSTNAEIAATLVVSVNTVKTQVQSIYRKLNVKNRWEASQAAHRLNLL